jgi:hypothetical protein
MRARAAAVVALASLGALVASLWPAAGVPAWPASAMGIAAVALALHPGPIRPRAFATVGGATAALLGWAQIGVLWLVALGLGGRGP